MAKSEFGSAFEKAYSQGKGTNFTFKGKEYAAYKKGERPAGKTSDFGAAFAKARAAHGGGGGEFEYQGKKYTTNIVGEGSGLKAAGKSAPKKPKAAAKDVPKEAVKLPDDMFPTPKNAGSAKPVQANMSPANTSKGIQDDITVGDVLKPIGIGIGVGALALNRVPNSTPMRAPSNKWNGNTGFFMGKGRNFATANVREIKPKQIGTGTPRQIEAGEVPKQIHAGVQPPSRDVARNAVSKVNARAKPVTVKGRGFSMTTGGVPKQSQGQYISKMAQGISRRAARAAKVLEGTGRALGAVGKVAAPAMIIYGGVQEALDYKRSKKGFQYKGRTLVNEKGQPVS